MTQLAREHKSKVGIQAVIQAVAFGESHDVTLTTSNQLSNAVPDGVTVARIKATGDCRVVQGDSPVASATTGALLDAGDIEYVRVDAGQKFAFYGVGAGGLANITWGQ